MWLSGPEARVFPGFSLPKQSPRDLAEARGYKVPQVHDFSLLVRPSGFLETPSLRGGQWALGSLTSLPSTPLLSPGQLCPG